MARNEKSSLELGLELWSYFFWGLINDQKWKIKNSRLELGLDSCT